MQTRFTQRQLWLGFLLSSFVVLALIIWKFGLQTQINHWNEKIFLIINQLAKKNKILDAAFLLLTQLGSGYVLVPLVGAIIWFKKRKRFWVYFGIFVLILALGGNLVHILKKTLPTFRPLLHFQSQGPGIVNIVGAALKRGSFPSGHAQTVFSGVLFLHWAFPKKRYLYWIIGVLVGISRCYVGVHFPLDVLGGFLVALLCFVIVKSIFNKKISGCDV
jgi:membrane-associated phospholipid phosphatase